MTIVRWAMYLTPYAVLGLITRMVMQTGVESIGGMFIYVATVVASPAAIMILYLVMVAVFGWMNPVSY
jgi:Na+/H+-dicarboxylate symporter